MRDKPTDDVERRENKNEIVFSMKVAAKKEKGGGNGAALTKTLTAARTETTFAAFAASAARWCVCVAILGVFAAFVERFGPENLGKGDVWGAWAAISVGVGSFLARRYWKRRPTTARLARRLEGRFAELAGILTAALEFAGDGDASTDGTSAELRSATIRTAIRRTEALWRELNAAERLGVVWNVDGAKTRRRTAVEFCVAGMLGVVALGVGTVGNETAGKIGGLSKIEKKGERSETVAAFWEEFKNETKNVAENNGVEMSKNRDENEKTLETSTEIASFADDLARASGVAANFAADLRRAAEGTGESADFVLTSTAREIESLVAVPGKGLRDRAARLERSATLAEATQNGENAQIGAFVAATTAVRAREFGAELADETLFDAFRALGAAFRSGDFGEKARAFDAAARTAERFAETARRERAAWSALAASWAFAERRREFQTGVDALFDASRSALTQAPGRSAFELANESGAVERTAGSLRETVDGAFGDFGRLRDSLTRDDAAEFLAFVERIARRTDAQTPTNVEKSARDWNASQTAALARVASTAASGRFGAAATLAEKLTFGTLETPKNAEEDSNSDAEKRRRAALAAARLTFGFGNGANDGDFSGSEDLGRLTAAESWGKPEVRGKKVDGENAVNGGDLAVDGASDKSAENAEPTSFADLRELADATIRELDGDAGATVNRENGGSDSEIAGGNAPDEAFSGGKARPDADATRPEIAAFDAFWNELPDVEKERLADALKTETPPEFDEKIRLYRRRLFDGGF